MTYLEAALEILRSSRRPLTIPEITERAISSKMVVPRGKTPQATMGAALYRALGTDNRLVKMGDPGSMRAKPGSVRWTVRKG
jgi:hypothetical protein